MVQGIANQILSETPSESPATVNANTEENGSQSGQPQSDAKEVPNFDERFNVLTKMERKLKERESQWKGKETEWEEKGKKLSELEEFMQLFEENPLEAMKKKKGWGVQEFNEFALKHSTDEDLDPVAKITKSFQDRMAEMEKAWEAKLTEKISEKEKELLSKEQERQVAEYKGELRAFLAENKDSYEFIHAEENGQEEVFNLIYADIQRQQEAGIEPDQLKIMDFKTAAEKVEAFLDKQYSKYLSLNKVKSKFQNSNDQLVSFIANKSKEEPTTLNSSFSPKSKPVDQLSPEERKQQAVAFLRQQNA